MSVSESLHTKLEELARTDSKIFRQISDITPQRIASDPSFKIEQHIADRDLQDLTLYQLHAKHKINAEIIVQLEELRSLRALHSDLSQSLESISSALADIPALETTIDHLSSALQRLQMFDNKTLEASNKNLAITFSLKDESNVLKSQFMSILTRILEVFVPTPSETDFTIKGTVDNTTSISLDRFYSISRDYEIYASMSDITDKLESIRSTWERKLLEPLISGHSFLELNKNGDFLTIRRRDKQSTEEFSFKDYFQSLNDFVSFVNATGIQSLKNFYSTKMSNSLVDVISENIESYMANQSILNQDLIYTLQHFTNSGWKIPIRNVFVSSDNVGANLNQLYINWTTNKYLETLRSLFSSDTFKHGVENPIAIEQRVPILAEQQKSKPISNTTEPAPVQEEKSEVSEELDWDQDWGSDIDEHPNSKRNSVASDRWSDKWDDDWDENNSFNASDAGWDEPEPEAKLPTISESKQSIPESTSQPLPQSTSESKTYQTVTMYQSLVPQKVSAILEEFRQATGHSEDKILLDAIFSLALVSYPPISDSLLFLNDLRAIETNNDYLKNLATLEWSHFCQAILNDSVEVVSLLNFSNSEEDADDTDTYLTRICGIVDGLFAKNLKHTNYVEFRTLLLQLMNLINTQVIDIIIESEEITEYQSEKITNFLESLQMKEEEYLGQVNETPGVLASTDKIIQTKLLINNRLKSIMDFFYQGELYEFSTDELITIIKAIFVPSELREGCIQEIIDIRSA